MGWQNLFGLIAPESEVVIETSENESFPILYLVCWARSSGPAIMRILSYFDFHEPYIWPFWHCTKIVRPKIPQMPQNLSAQFVCPSPKVLDFCRVYVIRWFANLTKFQILKYEYLLLFTFSSSKLRKREFDWSTFFCGTNKRFNFQLKKNICTSKFKISSN